MCSLAMCLFYFANAQTNNIGDIKADSASSEGAAADGSRGPARARRELTGR